MFPRQGARASVKVGRQTGPRQSRRPRSRPRLHFDSLEARQLLAGLVLTVNTTANSGGGSLLDAINQVNADLGVAVDTIKFQIGTGVQTIQPAAAGLPIITHSVLIDGTTQPGFAGTPLIVLNFSQVISNGDGLALAGGNSAVRGLVINDFVSQSSAGGGGIAIMTKGGDTIAGNYIGTQQDGTTAEPNSFGVRIADVGGNTIGGTTAADRNVISGNIADGVVIFSGFVSNNVIEGNYIGTDFTGTVAVPNGFWGVEADGSSNTIGGTAPGAGNVISGNLFDGILAGPSETIQGNFIGTDALGTSKLPNQLTGIMTQAAGSVIGGTTPGAANVISGNTDEGIALETERALNNVVEGNFIGTDKTQTLDLGNGGVGVHIFSHGEGGGADDNTVGGSTLSAANVIAFNVNGVQVDGGSNTTNSLRNLISHNSIFNNTGPATDGLGIVLGDLATPSMAGNNGQPAPVITSITPNGNFLTIVGTVQSVANSTVTVEFFANPSLDPSGQAEGQLFLGSVSVPTNGSGQGSFSQLVPAPSGAQAGFNAFSATVTDPNGNTSEFSNGFVAETGVTVTGVPVSAVEGAPFSGEVATLEGSGVDQSTTATIHWGDGTSSSGTITPVPGVRSRAVGIQQVQFIVTGQHTYAEEGMFSVTIILFAPSHELAQGTTTATVADAALSAHGVTIAPKAGVAFSGIVATFTDADPNGTPSDYSATITWGDGHTSAGTIDHYGFGGGFHVTGTNTYSQSGQFAIKVTIKDVGGSTAVANSTATVTGAVLAPPQVIGVFRVGIHFQPTQLILSFNEDMNAATVQDLRNYFLVPIGPNGRIGPHSVPIQVDSAVYHPGSRTVTLIPHHQLNFHLFYELVVNGMAPSGLRNSQGVLLDGAGTGEPGVDFFTVVHGLGAIFPKQVPVWHTAVTAHPVNAALAHAMIKPAP
jgi:hypothetical protein